MTNLKSRGLLASLALATVAAAALALAPQQPPPPPDQGRPGQQPPAQGDQGRRPPFDRQGGPGGPGGPGGRQISVSGAMKGLNRAARMLHEQIGDASKKTENLQLINDVQRGAISAKGAPLPEDIIGKAKDDTAKAKMTEDFRRALMKAVLTALDIEDNILAGRTDAAKAGREDLIKQRDAAHKTLGVELDEDER